MQFALFPIIFLLLSVKYVEILRAIIWSCKKSHYNAFHDLNRVKRTISFISFIKLLNKTKHPNVYFNKDLWRFRPVTKFFRYPILTAVLVVLLLAYAYVLKLDYKVLSVISLIYLLLGILLETIHIVIYRYKFGNMDNYLYATSTRITIFNNKDLFDIRNFIFMYAGLFAEVIMVFSMCYFLLPQEYGLVNNAGEPIQKGFLDLLTYLYFTVAALGTVGFGDVHAGHYSSMVLVTTEMIIGFVLFIIVLSAVMRSNESSH